METVHQAVNENGLQIPLALMRQYGLKQGSKVVLEFNPESIRVAPARLSHYEIENRALRYLLRRLGDSATVSAKFIDEDNQWQVRVYGKGISESIGLLTYSAMGQLIPELSISPIQLRQKAKAVSATL